IELDVSHAAHAPKKGFGYALGMIRKNEKMGGRPFFESIELRPGKPISAGLRTPEGTPAAAAKVLAYSRTATRGPGTFDNGSVAPEARDAKGRVQVAVPSPGEAIFWVLPKKYAPSAHKLKPDKRGDLGTIALQPGISDRGKVLDAKGKPVANVNVNVEREGVPEDEQVGGVADGINRSGLSNATAEFEIGPLAPGNYRVQPGEYARDSSLERKERRERPVPGVFLRQKFVLEENKAAPALVVRAVPHVIVEAQHFDSKGKKTR